MHRNHNRLRRTTASIALVGALASGCSLNQRSSESLGSPTPSSELNTAPVPEPTPSVISTDDRERIAHLGREAEATFIKNMRRNRRQQVLVWHNMCSVVAGPKNKLAVQAAALIINPLVIAETDPKSNINYDITVGYEAANHEFVFGPIDIIDPSQPADQQETAIAGTGDEVDYSPEGVSFSLDMVEVSWSSKKHTPIDSSGASVASVIMNANVTMPIPIFASSVNITNACANGVISSLNPNYNAASFGLSTQQ